MINFDKLEDHVEDFKGFDVGYSSLGTTRNKAGAVNTIFIIYHSLIITVITLLLISFLRCSRMIASRRLQ